MSIAKNISSKSNKSNCGPQKKPYHFFNFPPTILLQGEINKIIDGVSKKIFFTLHDEDFLFYEVESVFFCSS